MWTAQYYPYQNGRQLVTSGGLGTMGFGVPAAIGAKDCQSEKKVILLSVMVASDDQSELAILNIYKIPIGCHVE